MSILRFTICLVAFVSSRRIVQQSLYQASYLSLIMDPNNEAMNNSGFYTSSDVSHLYSKAVLMFLLSSGVDFTHGSRDPVTGIVRVKDALLYPYALSYNLTLDSDHPERSNNWTVSEYGYMMSMIAKNPGDTMYYTEYWYHPVGIRDKSISEAVASVSTKFSTIVPNRDGSFDLVLTTVAYSKESTGLMRGSVTHPSYDKINIYNEIEL